MSIGRPPYDSGLSVETLAYLERIRQELLNPRRPIYIPVTEFNGHLSDSFLGNGVPDLEQINSLGIVGARINAIDDTCHHLWRVPHDLNIESNIRFSVVWITNSTDVTETATWVVQYNAIAAGESLVAASTALDTLIAADNVLGSFVIAESPYGVLYRNNLNHGDYLHLNVSLGAVSGLSLGVDRVFLLGILINDE